MTRSKAGVKRDRGSPERFKLVIDKVQNGGTIRTVAREFGLKKSISH